MLSSGSGTVLRFRILAVPCEKEMNAVYCVRRGGSFLAFLLRVERTAWKTTTSAAAKVPPADLR
jgi:hypothetical protein